MLQVHIDCPRCFARCKRRIRAGVEIDICPKCFGIWLDTKELSKLVHNRSLYAKVTKYAEMESTSKLLCPRCGGLMNIEHADEVEVDVCLSCKGVWLDPGELEDLKAKEKERFDTYDPDREAKIEKIHARDRREFWRNLLRTFRR